MTLKDAVYIIATLVTLFGGLKLGNHGKEQAVASIVIQKDMSIVRVQEVYK